MEEAEELTLSVKNMKTESDRAEPTSTDFAGEVQAEGRVIYRNPGGYDNYQGTVKRVFMWGDQEWADIKWDLPYHPCTTPMETRHLIPVKE